MLKKQQIFKVSLTVIAMLFLLFSCVTSGSGDNSARKGKQPRPALAGDTNKVIAYYSNWGIYDRNFHVKNLPLDQITHINYAFAKINNGFISTIDANADYTKVFGDEPKDAPYKGNFYQFKMMKEKYPHIKMLISIGGWTLSDGFGTVAADPELRERMTESAILFMRKFDFDGIDLDWEYPVEGGINQDTSPDDKQNFSLLLRDLRLALDKAEDEDGREYYLTAAVTAGVDKIKNLEVAALNKYLNWVNIMCYDFYVAGPGPARHHAPLYVNPNSPKANDYENYYSADSAVQAYLEAGLAPEKLVLGVPLYGRAWQGFGGASDALFQRADGVSKVGTWEAGTIEYVDIEENYLPRGSEFDKWDDVAKASYLYYPEEELFVSYESQRSLSHKLEYITENKLGGIMYWELANDTNFTLVHQIGEYMLKQD
jgi:chitinase